MDYRSTDWGNPKGIKCAMETTPITNISRPFKLGTDWRLFREEEEVIRGMRFPVSFINITAMTEFRKDAHTSVHTLRQGKLLTREQQADPASFADCIHWCLPGLPDTWNDDFFKKRSGVREKDPLQATTEGIYTCRAYGGRTVVYNGCDAFGLTVGTTLRHATPLPIFKVSIDEASDREYDNQGNRHGIWPSVPRLSGHRGEHPRNLRANVVRLISRDDVAPRPGMVRDVELSRSFYSECCRSFVPGNLTAFMVYHVVVPFHHTCRPC
ncbi:hypothetical protein BHM03_00043573, partial [Ensete ventricosum]